MKGRTAPIAADASDRLLNPRFVAILAAQVFSLLGMEILQFVLPLHLLNLTGSGTLYGGVLAAGFVPYTLLAPVGGVVADRTRKRGVMVAVDATLAAVMAAYLALEGSSGIVALTIAVLMVAFAAQALYQPCVQSAMPHVVSPRYLEQAVAVTNQVGMVTSIAGPVAGGLALGFWGIGPIVALSAASFAVAAALAAAFVRVPYEPPARTAGPLETVRDDLSEALGFLRSHPFFLRVIVAATLANLFGSSYFNVGAPYVVTESLGLTNQQIGLYYGTFGAGAFLLGSLLAGYYIAARGLRRTLFTLVCIFNLPFLVYALLAAFQPQSMWLVGGGIVLEYFGYGFGFVGLTLFMMQQVAPGKHQMAHYAFASGIMNLSVMLTGAVSGFLSDLCGYKLFFLLVMVATVPVFVMTRFLPFTYPDEKK